MEMRNKEIKVTEHYYDHVLTQNYSVVIQIGGRFSGKSHNEEVRLVGNLASKENYKLLVIEDLETGMADGFHSGLYARINDFEHTDAYTPQSRVAHIKNTINGNEVLFRGYATEQQRLNVKKLVEITEIIVEEGEWLDYESFIGLLQQLRGGKEEDRRLTILMNPVNPDCFVNEMFIETPPDYVKVRFADGRPKVFEKHITTKFTLEGVEVEQTVVVLIVLSTHFDNPFLSLEQRATIEQLKETDPEKYMQLGEAKFIRPSGTFFHEFKRHIHVIDPFIMPEEWRRYFVMDYGLDKLAGYWVALDDGGKAYVYKEVWESDLIISKAAEMINEYTNESLYERYAPPDLWNRRQETGKSAFEVFGENGVWLTKTDRVNEHGCLSFKEWLNPYEDEQGVTTANVQITSNCVNLIKSIGAIQADPKRPTLYDKEPHILTHSVDAMIYFFGGRPAPYRPKMKTEGTKLIDAIKPKRKLRM